MFGAFRFCDQLLYDHVVIFGLSCKVRNHHHQHHYHQEIALKELEFAEIEPLRNNLEMETPIP